MSTNPPDWPKASVNQALRGQSDQEVAQEDRSTWRLCDALEVGSITFPHRLKLSPEFAFCILLRRLSFAGRSRDSCELFGGSESYLSKVFTAVCEHLPTRFGEIIRRPPRLRRYDLLLSFARALHPWGTQGHIWGFIDGHFQGCAKPAENQRFYYFGHTNEHGMKFPAFVTPDGLISSLIGPFEGRMNDWGIFLASRVPQEDDAAGRPAPATPLRRFCVPQQLLVPSALQAPCRLPVAQCRSATHQCSNSNRP